ncbi:hypothetical protein ALO54_102412 [Pseudomonas syringae pv. philadelphi]|nr:hypothetical protein ALO86_102149 [Pseudomonas syringae pv. berberidis]KPY09153.1 hypothetical protein ALO54_102412 [Pseudomonas syringae pv. philadelphi]RMM29965.1 hypothetical protein ALQ83_102478 [Pseudomonas syringae pv. berberidis]
MRDNIREDPSGNNTVETSAEVYTGTCRIGDICARPVRGVDS